MGGSNAKETYLHIRNFKAWKDTGPIRLAPLTIIFGANSAGKSSLGHLLLTLKQTALSADRKRPLQLGDENSLIDLGTFAECLHNHDLRNVLGFELGWKVPNKELVVRDPVTQKKFSGDELHLAIAIAADSKEQPRVDKLTYQLLHNNINQLDVSYLRDGKNKLEIASEKYKFVRNTGRIWPLDDPDKFYRISDQSRARFQNADFLLDFALNVEAALNSVYYLGPLRDHPKRIYSWSGETPESVGQKGELAIAAILAASSEDRKLNRGKNQRISRFDEFIAESHSEHFLNRLQRRVAEGVVKPEDVAVYFCQRNGSATELEPLRLNIFGEIENWPENFFGDEMADIAGRTLAALKRKKELAAEGKIK